MEPTPGAGPRYDRDVIWEPFVLALFLGLIVSAGLYFAYLWPSVEPEEPVAAAAHSEAPAPPEPDAAAEPATDTPADEPAAETASDDEASPPS